MQSELRCGTAKIAVGHGDEAFHGGPEYSLKPYTERDHSSRRVLIIALMEMEQDEGLMDDKKIC